MADLQRCGMEGANVCIVLTEADSSNDDTTGVSTGADVSSMFAVSDLALAKCPPSQWCVCVCVCLSPNGFGFVILCY